MPAQWTAEIVGQLHAHRIKQADLAAYLGWSAEWLSAILNGRREPKNAEQTVRAALAELIAEREQ